MTLPTIDFPTPKFVSSKLVRVSPVIINPTDYQTLSERYLRVNTNELDPRYVFSLFWLPDVSDVA